MRTIGLCIPAYNAEKYLNRLLTSAKHQIRPFDEIIVFDDARTDSTSVVAKENGAKVIKGVKNVGCSTAKNVMAEACRCDWIHFHDADDELLPEFTTLAFEWINMQKAPDVVLFAYEYRDNETGNLLGVRTFDRVNLELDAIAYAIREQINPFCGLYNRSRFIKAGGYDIDPAVLYNEDTALHIRLAIRGLTFSADDRVSIINYRISSSMSAVNKHKCIEAQFNVLNKTAERVAETHFRDIAFRLWEIIGPMAAQNNWPYVKKALLLSRRLGYRHPFSGSLLFKGLTRLDPYFGIWFREKMIRLVKKRELMAT
jgi:glycosyltransferase involved in cell wall biosynthesis